MTDSFAALVMPVFRNGIELQDRLSGDEPRSLDDVKRMTSAWIEDARRRSLASPALKSSFELARFGLVAWIDEILTDSEWGRHVGQPDDILEWDQFSSRDRATLFYAHAERADEVGDLDALEVYLLATTLGFKGELIYEEERLADWVHQVYGRISQASAVPDRPFGEDTPPRGPLEPLRGPSLLLVVSILVSVTVLVTLAAYLVSVHVYYETVNPESTAQAVDRASAVDCAARARVWAAPALSPSPLVAEGWGRDEPRQRRAIRHSSAVPAGRFKEPSA